ncbi:TetR/AcrR family transcriptional regulator [Nocardioides rotundus]|uniref:TetR/AcrR family transcriptional regulator n=1 Tax=Nocardioides rotundus TaxID=1774216 RepID=UPI001CBB13A2|nr:TetR/AcrR family transcriptional regulator [Nocardioides rotundus]UAL29160.1 TetR/AcrR family transcriptional regulator [Nocardioides rotundus]
MVANPARRTQLAHAAITVLGTEGPRALTHRAVDRQAGLPLGTCANYFPTRAELLLAMAHEVFQLLAPDPDRLEQLADLPVEDAAAGYATYVTERLLEHPHVATALIELRLEAARSEDVRAVLAPVLQQGFEADVAFHQERGLPGGRDQVLLMHHVVNGAVLDALTIPLHPESPAGDVVAQAARRLTA